jgi:hypothetical protein
MTRMYPIFTDGKDFYHSEDIYPSGCRFAYFSELKLNQWKKKEKKEIEGKAKKVFKSWEKNSPTKTSTENKR